MQLIGPARVGEFMLADSHDCYALTITDFASRFARRRRVNLRQVLAGQHVG